MGTSLENLFRLLDKGIEPDMPVRERHKLMAKNFCGLEEDLQTFIVSRICDNLDLHKELTACKNAVESEDLQIKKSEHELRHTLFRIVAVSGAVLVVCYILLITYLDHASGRESSFAGIWKILKIILNLN